jgi:hypothetical protein
MADTAQFYREDVMGADIIQVSATREHGARGILETVEN